MQSQSNSTHESAEDLEVNSQTSNADKPVTVSVPRDVYESVVRPILELVARLEGKTLSGPGQALSKALALKEATLLTRLVGLKPAHRRAPWATALLNALLAKMHAKGAEARSYRVELRRQLSALDDQSLLRLLPSHKRKPPTRARAAVVSGEAESANSSLKVAVGPWHGSVESIESNVVH